MNGQWIGNYSGTNRGEAFADIDDLKTYYEGVAYLFDDDASFPGSVVNFRTPGKSLSFDLEVKINPLDRRTGRILTPDEFPVAFPGVTFPKTAKTKWKRDGSEITIDWHTDIETKGEVRLKLNAGNEPSIIQPLEIGSWDEFKAYANKLESGKFMFRGQENSTWRLRTLFHRTGRANLLRYIHQDLPALRKNLSHLTAHVFDFDKPIEYGAFVSLAQHHGYPTPLLDWTFSPYVAAYFAFNDLKTSQISENQNVRILVFHNQSWTDDFPQYQMLAVAEPHFSILEALALNNPRMVPQQALASVTNISDIESYIKKCEQKSGKTYLQAIDLPASSRNNVFDELRLMGITAGSLFPGLDGACRQLKEQFFKPI
jgi:FRG domain